MDPEPQSSFLDPQTEDFAAWMTETLGNRLVIEQAKGILMAQGGIGPEAAFRLLVERSQAENRKIRDIARQIIADVQGPDVAGAA